MTLATNAKRHLAGMILAAACAPMAALAAYDCTTLKATACLLGDGDTIPSATVAVQLPKGLCTGTVLATVDGTTASQLILTAAHCLALPSEPAPAGTLSTTVFYGALGGCVTGNSAMQSATAVARSSISATADVLVYDPPRTVAQPDGSTKPAGTDAAIIRINSPAPRGVYFASWNAASLAMGGQSTTVGHGQGYQSTYARGITEIVDSNDDKFGSFSTDGNLAGGHSGSGVYSSTGELVGQLSSRSCTENAPAGSGLREGTLSGYGRFSSVYLLARSYLDPDNSGATSAVGYFAPTPPDVTFTVGGAGTSYSGTAGSVVSLAWSASADATSCLATGSWAGTKPTSGTTAISVEVGTRNYTLSCTNSSGSTAQTVTITGSTPPPSGGSSGGSSGGASSGGGAAGGSGGGSLTLLGLIPMLMASRRKRK